jgi:4,5-dihydroxyphthalate decarboxylase
VSQLRLTLAVGDYDHTRDLALDTSAISRGDDRFIAIPVFPSRVFRHSAIYIRKDGGIAKPDDLAGKRVGCPQWSQTASIYVRGYLSETVGVDLSSIHPPRRFLDGDTRIIRLFPDYRAAEEEYFRNTGIFPIMHTVAIRRDVYENNRWIARNLLLAFDEAKERSVARMADLTAAHAPLPWIAELTEHAGRDLVFKQQGFWPYGTGPNRVTLDAFLRFAYDQGTCHRRLAVEELFAEEALAQIKV